MIDNSEPDDCPVCAGWGYNEPTFGEPDGTVCVECNGTGTRILASPPNDD